MSIEVIICLKWENLRALNLNINKLTDFGLSKLIKRQWPMLKQLDLCNNMIRDEGANILFRHLPQKLESLSLNNFQEDQSQDGEEVFNSITYLGLFNICQYQNKNIKQLNLGGNNVGCKGVKLLIKSGLYGLKLLKLENCRVGTTGANFLTKSDWKFLTQVNLIDNYFSFDGLLFFTNNWNYLAILNYSEQLEACAIFLMYLVVLKSKMLKEIGFGDGSQPCFGFFDTDLRAIYHQKLLNN